MGQHDDPDSLALIDWLAEKGKKLGYCVEKECPAGDNDYNIDLVWKFKPEQDPLITFEVETTNSRGVFTNTLKILGTRQSLVRKPLRHFAIVVKSKLTPGQKEMLAYYLTFCNMSLYENLLYDTEKQKELQNEINNLISNEAVAQEPIISFLKSKIYLDSIILRAAIANFGIEKLPFLLKDDLVSQDTHAYFSIATNLDYINRRFTEIKNAKDITEPDFEAIVTLLKMAERIDATENLLLSHNQCPKCGSKITERQEYHGGNTESDPEPYAVTYIVGCEACDYELNEETIYL